MRTRRFFSLYFLLFFLLLAFTPPPVIGADSTGFNPTTVAVEAKSAGGGVPVGTIVAWPVASNPEDMDNWLECNGQAVSQTAYPELFALVGARVPDYRGEFLRGVDAGRGIDPGRTIGSWQNHAMQSHNHGWTGIEGGGYPKEPSERTTPGHSRAYVCNTRIIDVGEGTENRPRNIAVRYLVRSRP